MSESLINPNLDRNAIRDEFDHQGKVRIANVLREDFADAIYNCLSHDVPWRLMYYNPGVKGPAVVGRLFPEQRQAMSEDELLALESRVQGQASEQFQYLYQGYDVLHARRNNTEPGLLLQQFLSFMGTDELFNFVQEVTGDDQFNRVDCHACQYLPGHFLREHVDSSPFENRMMAYVFYFTKDWHPDFGGVTYFLDDDGLITDAFLPEFNSLTLFKVPVGHCVSQVASFAPHARNSITGWFTRYD